MQMAALSKRAKEGTLSLRDWIDETGIREVAKLLNVHHTAVGHWRRGICLPRSVQMEAIHRYSNGRVAYSEMIETFCKAQAKLKSKKR